MAIQIDLRTSLCMPPVKFQGCIYITVLFYLLTNFNVALLLGSFAGECGSCYTFAAITTVEYGHCMRTGSLVLLR